MLMGIGGTPEGVISAAAIKCMGGAIQGRLWPRNDGERTALVDGGFDLERMLSADDLVSGEDIFVAATGVTGGSLLRGVRASKTGVETESIVMRSRSGTVRRISAFHPNDKLVNLRREGLAFRVEGRDPATVPERSASRSTRSSTPRPRSARRAAARRR